MNTNEFRHPKERLQNLSSRHKVSTIYCVLLCVCFLFFVVFFLFSFLEFQWWEDVEVMQIIGGGGWVIIEGSVCLHVRTWVWCAGWRWSSSPCRSVEGSVRGSAGTRGCYLALAWHSPEVFLFIFISMTDNNSNNLEAATFSILFCLCASAQRRTPVCGNISHLVFIDLTHLDRGSKTGNYSNLFTPIKFSREAHQHPLLRLPDCVGMLSMFLPVLRTQNPQPYFYADDFFFFFFFFFLKPAAHSS